MMFSSLWCFANANTRKYEKNIKPPFFQGVILIQVYSYAAGRKCAGLKNQTQRFARWLFKCNCTGHASARCKFAGRKRGFTIHNCQRLIHNLPLAVGHFEVKWVIAYVLVSYVFNLYANNDIFVTFFRFV